MQLAALRIYPVKSLRGLDLTQAAVEPWGLAQDRRWMVVDVTGRFVTQREHGTMALIEATPTPAGLQLAAGTRRVEVATPDADAERVRVTVWGDTLGARVASPAAASLLSEAIGIACRLVWLDDPLSRPADPAYAPAGSTVSFADGFPLLLTTQASLDALNARLPAPVTCARFRPNVVIAGSEPWAEDGWRRIRIGAVAFTVAKPCERCMVTTVDPDTGLRPDKSEPLRTLARFRRDARGGVMFGQNLVPEQDGTIAVGDPVVVLELGEANVEIVAEREG